MFLRHRLERRFDILQEAFAGLAVPVTLRTRASLGHLLLERRLLATEFLSLQRMVMRSR